MEQCGTSSTHKPMKVREGEMDREREAEWSNLYTAAK